MIATEARSTGDVSRHWRWLFVSIPGIFLLAMLAAWAVPDIAFFEAWPALNVLLFLLGLAVIPVFSLNASLARKFIHPRFSIRDIQGE